MKKTIGLDLGASKGCVAVADDTGAAAVLPDGRGEQTTPSFVAFDERHTLIGSDARDQAAINPSNTVYGFKTILGRNLDDPFVCEKLNSKFNYIPVPPETGGKVPLVRVQYKSEALDLRLEQVAALLMEKMKSNAENFLGYGVTKAVIPVPVAYNTSQRQAVLDAAHIVGFKNVSLVNCTTAAAVAYWEHKRMSSDRVGVVDIGAGSLNFAIVSKKDGHIVVDDAFGDCKVGGDDMDRCIMAELVKKFAEQHPNGEVGWSKKLVMRLMFATRKLKHNLTLLPSATVQVDSYFEDVDVSTTFTRREMESSCQEILKLVRSGLMRLKKSEYWKDVRCVVLVGGSTRVPAIQACITKGLKVPVDQSLNKDEAVACGAAILGSKSRGALEVQDILGRTILSQNSVAFDVQTDIPSEEECKDSAPGVKVKEEVSPLLQNGEKETFSLLEFDAKDEEGVPQQGGLIFSLNESGVFRAEKISLGKSRDLPLKISSLNDTALHGCVETHRTFLEDEKEILENDSAINELECLCFEQRELLLEKQFAESEKILEFLDDVLNWLEETPDATKQQCSQKTEEIHKKIETMQKKGDLSKSSKHYQNVDNENSVETSDNSSGKTVASTNGYNKNLNEEKRLDITNNNRPNLPHELDKTSTYSARMIMKVKNQNGELPLWSEIDQPSKKDNCEANHSFASPNNGTAKQTKKVEPSTFGRAYGVQGHGVVGGAYAGGREQPAKPFSDRRGFEQQQNLYYSPDRSFYNESQTSETGFDADSSYHKLPSQGNPPLASYGPQPGTNAFSNFHYDPSLYPQHPGHAHRTNGSSSNKRDNLPHIHSVGSTNPIHKTKGNPHPYNYNRNAEPYGAEHATPSRVFVVNETAESLRYRNGGGSAHRPNSVAGRVAKNQGRKENKPTGSTDGFGTGRHTAQRAAARSCSNFSAANRECDSFEFVESINNGQDHLEGAYPGIKTEKKPGILKKAWNDIKSATNFIFRLK